ESARVEADDVAVAGRVSQIRLHPRLFALEIVDLGLEPPRLVAQGAEPARPGGAGLGGAPTLEAQTGSRTIQSAVGSRWRCCCERRAALGGFGRGQLGPRTISVGKLRRSGCPPPAVVVPIARKVRHHPRFDSDHAARHAANEVDVVADEAKCAL